MRFFLRYLSLCLCVCFVCVLPKVSFAEPGDEFYFEDFSATDEGMLPEGWKGGDIMAVERIDGKSVLKPFAPGDIDIVTAPIAFPENFSLEISLMSKGKSYSWAGVKIGLDDLSVALGNIKKGSFANFLRVTRGGERGIYKPINVKAQKLADGSFASYRVTIEKKGVVYKVFLGNEKMFIGRFKGINPTKIRFSTAGVESRLPFRIKKIVGVEL